MLNPENIAPDFTLRNKDGNEVNLYQLLENKSVVLYFYPKDETPGCIKEACTFRDNYEDFLEAGAEVVGVSMDSTGSHLRFANNRKLPFILLSDPKGKVHDLYEVEGKFFGLWRSRYTYVIGRDRKIKASYNAGGNIEGHIGEALEVVKGLNES